MVKIIKKTGIPVANKIREAAGKEREKKKKLTERKERKDF